MTTSKNELNNINENEDQTYKLNEHLITKLSKKQFLHFAIPDIRDPKLKEFVVGCTENGFDNVEAVSPIIEDKEENVVITHLGYIRDDNNADLMMHAFKTKRFDLIQNLLNYDADLNRMDNYGKRAIDYAVSELSELKDIFDDEELQDQKRECLEAIAHLFRNGSPNAKKFIMYKDSPVIKDIMQARKKLRHEIPSNIELGENPIDKYFYDEHNQSLANFLIKSKPEHAINLIDKYNLKIGDHEEYDILEYIFRKQKTHRELFLCVLCTILLKKCRNNNGESIKEQELEFVKIALMKLLKNEASTHFMQMCAVIKMFLVFLDIEVYGLKEENIRGITNGMSKRYGHVYICAKGLKENSSEVIGVIVHEFTHIAIQFTYFNNFNPYPQDFKAHKGENHMKDDFEKIFENIKSNTDKNNLNKNKMIKNVFQQREEGKEPSEEEQHSELFATLVEMLTQESYTANELKEMEFYKFIKNRVNKDIKDTIPTLIRLQMSEEDSIDCESLPVPMQVKISNSESICEENLKNLNSKIIKNLVMHFD